MPAQGILTVATAHNLPLATDSINCCVTSPPYFGLREYHGHQVTDWPWINYCPMAGVPKIVVDEWQGPLGAEPTIEMYIAHMVLVGREIARVLDPNGVLWLNIGDSYNGSGGAGGDYNPGGIRDGQPRYPGRSLGALQAGDLIMVPARLALALQADGWIIRNDVIWHKKSPMPEPNVGWRFEKPPCDCVKTQREAHIKAQMEEQGVERHRIYDKAGTKFKPAPDCPKCHGSGRLDEYQEKRGSWRHTKSHEYIWMLTRKMGYFCDQERVREEHLPQSIQRNKYAWDSIHRTHSPGEKRGPDHKEPGDLQHPAGRNPRSVVKTDEDYLDNFHRWLKDREGIDLHSLLAEFDEEATNPESLVVASRGSNYSGKHFAVFPPALIAPLIHAATPLRRCPECGEPWIPIVDRDATKDRPFASQDHMPEEGRRPISGNRGNRLPNVARFAVDRTVGGYRPTCGHQAAPVPGIVLDPFMGSGTTGLVAREFGVNFVGCDISFEYLDEQAKVRTKTGSPSKALDGLPLFETGEE